MTKKKTASKKAPSTSSEGPAYWQNRPSDDERKDWRTGGSWIEEYVDSASHPHRDLILTVLRRLSPFAGVLEVGCNAGPNLLRINEVYPETQLAGVDINPDAIERAQQLLPKALLKVGTLDALPFEDQSFDVGIADAVFLYADKTLMKKAMDELNRVVRKGLIFVEWHATKEGIIDHHWARDYEALMESYGFDVYDITNLTPETWPNEKWASHGKVFASVRRSPTSKTD